MAIQLKWLSKNLPRVLPHRSNKPISFKTTLILSNLSEEIKTKLSNQPRLNYKLKDYYKIPRDYISFFNSTFISYNPLVFASSEFQTVTIQGMITELGAPVLNRRVLVVLMTTLGDVVEKVFTDLEGNFVFYEIPQNLSLMAVAIDNTYKYNATILSKILTVDNGE